MFNLPNTFKSTICVSLLAYVNLCIIFYFLKPSIFFHNDKPKKFGIINNDQTLFPFYLVALMISVMIYFIFTIYKYNSD